MTKDAAIAKLTPVFRRYGYEGASLSMLSKATGLGKASLYHHFPGGKAEMALAVLGHVAGQVKDYVLSPLQAEGEPIERIRAMAGGISTLYRQGQDACFMAIFSMGEADTLFHDILQQSLATWLTQLAQTLVEAGIGAGEAEVRSRNTVMSIQGALILVRILGDTTPFDDLMAELPERLLGK
ncbi:MAG: TetR/AcrR family transcriptional regulator [Cyanobacteria bacterium P01_D01_bin.44]